MVSHPISIYRKTFNDHKKYGNIYGKYINFKYSISTCSPEMTKTILTDSKTFTKIKDRIPEGTLPIEIAKIFHKENVLFSNGDSWKGQRKSIDPGFYNLSIYYPIFMEKTNIVLNYLKENPLVSDVHDLLQKMALDILGSSVFHHEFNSLDGSNQKDLVSYNNIMDSMLNVKNMAIMVLSKKLHLPYSKENFYNEHGRTIVLLIEKMIEDSKKKLEFGENPSSLLDFMIQSHLDGNMTKEQLISNTFIFFLAGHETTAKSLTWIIQLLSKYPQIQEKARKEVESILQGKVCTYEDISKLDYLSMVIKEAMRLYGPVGEIQREVTKDIVLGGYSIPIGSLVSVSIFGLHHV
jgi:cytochrome P450